MDAHDDWTELLEQLQRFKGQFSVNAHGQVRHKTRTAIAPDWTVGLHSGPEMACPLNFLCQQLLSERGESVPVLENGDFADMATMLGIPQEYVERFAQAADAEELAPDDAALRHRIIDNVC
jgi:hypothetical protein